MSEQHIHIYRASGPYIGQIRPQGCRLWKTVSKSRKSAALAMIGAIKKMPRHHKARVLMLDDYNEPILCMELKR